MDLLSSDLALRCGDRGEAEASGRGASLGRSCGREQSRQHQPVPSSARAAGGRASGTCYGQGAGLCCLVPWHLCPRGQDLRGDRTHAQTPGPEPPTACWGLSRSGGQGSLFLQMYQPLSSPGPHSPWASEVHRRKKLGSVQQVGEPRENGRKTEGGLSGTPRSRGSGEEFQKRNPPWRFSREKRGLWPWPEKTRRKETRRPQRGREQL